MRSKFIDIRGEAARTFIAGMTVLASAAAGDALAAQPEPWAMGLQPAASPVMTRIVEFHDIVLLLMTAITLFVVGLLAFVLTRFRQARNPVPSKTVHNTKLEVLWTVIPVVILVGLAVPSFKLLYFMDRNHEAEMTLKVTGSQWFWSYEYPDHGDIAFDALMVAEEDLEEGQLRLLETDNRVVLPVDTDIRLLFTAADVMHSWAVPAFGVKVDSVPGRTNEAWVRVEREGTYYGQCSELCGVDHAFMPIAVEVVSREAFDAWVKKAKVEFAGGDGEVRIAATAITAN